MNAILAPINTIRPIRDRVVVRLDPAEETSKGGIIMTEGNHSKLNRAPPQKGTVLQVGPGRTMDSGAHSPTTLQPGDRVLVEFCRGAKTKVNGEEVTICYEEDIVAVFDNEAEVYT